MVGEAWEDVGEGGLVWQTWEVDVAGVGGPDATTIG